MVDDSHPITSERFGSVLRLRLNRPSKFNAIDRDTLDRLTHHLSGLRRAGEVRCVILSGTGRAFAAGADISGYHGADRGALRDFTERANAVGALLRSAEVPVVAAVNGLALGGGFELAMSCDIVIAAESARFGLPELSLGLIPGWGGTQLLARHLGRPAALEAILLGTRFSASEALQHGFVQHVVPDTLLDSEALALARRIAALPAKAVASAKRAVAAAIPFDPAASRLEIDELVRLFDTHDGREGVAAFVQKREAQWAGSARAEAP